MAYPGYPPAQPGYPPAQPGYPPACPVPGGYAPPAGAAPVGYPGAPGAPVMNPRIPYSGPVQIPLMEGQMIIIQGSIPYNCSRFVINLQQGPGLGETSDIALHINPRFEGTNQVIRNHLQRGAWGAEERHGAFPFALGQPFECIILVQNDCYKVAINGAHHHEFRHRVAKEAVTHVAIEGEVQISQIRFQGPGIGSPYAPAPAPPHPGYAPPPYQPAPAPGPYAPPPQPVQPVYSHLPVPYKQQFPGGLYPGRMIYITGTPNPSGANRFAINFKVADHKMSDVAFHFNPRFPEQKVVRNSYVGNNWGREESTQSYFPFQPGQKFDMVIMIDQKAYKVAINNNHFTEYTHRLGNLKRISWLEITGDLQLHNVHVQ